MMDMLPIDSYAWCNFTNERFFLDHILSTPDDATTGFILEIDLEYPPELHDRHNDFPVAPHKMLISDEILSPYAKMLKDNLIKGGMKPSSSEKLVSTFLKRTRYTVHFRNLKFYVAQGLIVKKIHRVISFRQKAWLRPYIEFCTRKRQQATTPFISNLYELFVNSIYGKLMEDKRKHVQVKLYTSESNAMGS